MRPISLDDVPALGALYFAAYDPGVAASTLDDAIADVEASFAGEYGELWLDASPCAVADGDIVAAAMTVRQAPWPDVPVGPFIIELFTARDWRRRGLAVHLLGVLAASVAAAGGDQVGLRVAEDNDAALILYRGAGFDVAG